MYTVSILAKYVENPTEENVRACKRVLKYLGGTKHYKLNFTRHQTGNNGLVCYTDADYATDTKTRKSRTGCLVFAYGSYF